MSKILNKITFALALGFLSEVANAQQVPMYTHYMYNTLSINPGYAGSRDAFTVTALHRSQWVSYKGAPITQTLTMHAPLKNKNIGLGLSVLNDKIGPVNNSSLFGHFAYIMELNEKSKLSLGVSGGVNIFQASLSSLQLDQQSDVVFQNNISNKITPNVGFGAYYARERFYAGVSTPNLMQNNYATTIKSDGTSLVAKEQRHYYLIAGSVISISDNLAFKPTTLIKVTEAAPIQADVTASFIIAKKLLLGVMYRTGDSYGALVGLDLSTQLHLGYSFDYSYGLKTGKYNNGSHELILRYDVFVFDKKQIHSPRYF